MEYSKCHVLTWNTQNADVVVGDYDERGEVEKEGRENERLHFPWRCHRNFWHHFWDFFASYQANLIVDCLGCLRRQIYTGMAQEGTAIDDASWARVRSVANVFSYSKTLLC